MEKEAFNDEDVFSPHLTRCIVMNFDVYKGVELSITFRSRIDDKRFAFLSYHYTP